jgi:hypothetical protein
MRRASWLIGLIPVLAAAACGSGSATTPAVTSQTTAYTRCRPEPGKAVPACVVRRLTALADRVISINDGHGVEWASAVVTTQEKALTSATPGDTVPGDKKTIVYLVTMKGHFTAVDYSGPPGSHTPTGTYMSLVIIARSFSGSDAGLGNKPPPVAPASLGPVTYLKVGAAGSPTTQGLPS